MIREHRGWLMLCDVQIAYKRMLAEYDTLIAEIELRDGPSLMSIPPEAREAEIRRRHGEQTAPPVSDSLARHRASPETWERFKALAEVGS